MKSRTKEKKALKKTAKVEQKKKSSTKEGKNKAYNFPELKMEFFASSEKSAKPFFEKHCGGYNKYIGRESKGWAEQKKKIMQAVEKRLNESLSEIKADEMELRLLHRGRKLVAERALHFFQTAIQMDTEGSPVVEKYIDEKGKEQERVVMSQMEIRPHELVDLLRVFRTELNMPMNISRSDSGDLEKMGNIERVQLPMPTPKVENNPVLNKAFWDKAEAKQQKEKEDVAKRAESARKGSSPDKKQKRLPPPRVESVNQDSGYEDDEGIEVGGGGDEWDDDFL